MGTTGVPQTAEETRQMLLRDFEYTKPQGYSHVLASAKGAGGFWILREVEYTDYLGAKIPKHVTATFIKMSSAAGMTYYKEIDIDCGPLLLLLPKVLAGSDSTPMLHRGRVAGNCQVSPRKQTQGRQGNAGRIPWNRAHGDRILRGRIVDRANTRRRSLPHEIGSHPIG